MKIKQAAVKDSKGVVHTLPRPKRHHSILHEMFSKGIKTNARGEIQGFVTERGEFVDRRGAAMIALAGGQIEALKWPPYLYSEDLW